ncbi:hypothetical protein JHD46_05420 [Sulfurimonas sp. SAG-AH-194-C20]|nr:hypothetical protein [Sulfurimonas sp. SAG-AH-194-C20]MDF1879079.1 hypothetical protein [Sulfurimonas sp. SAG-AH-194-C20]
MLNKNSTENPKALTDSSDSSVTIFNRKGEQEVVIDINLLLDNKINYGFKKVVSKGMQYLSNLNPALVIATYDETELLTLSLENASVSPTSILDTNIYLTMKWGDMTAIVTTTDARDTVDAYLEFKSTCKHLLTETSLQYRAAKIEGLSEITEDLINNMIAKEITQQKKKILISSESLYPKSTPSILKAFASSELAILSLKNLISKDQDFLCVSIGDEWIDASRDEAEVEEFIRETYGNTPLNKLLFPCREDEDEKIVGSDEVAIVCLVPSVYAKSDSIKDSLSKWIKDTGIDAVTILTDEKEAALRVEAKMGKFLFPFYIHSNIKGILDMTYNYDTKEFTQLNFMRMIIKKLSE